MSKSDRLLELVELWGGPVSCAVYLPNVESILELFFFVERQSHIFHDLVSLHVILERVDAKYPINRLRNLALENIESEYFFNVDVDFMPSYGIYEHLKEFVTQNDNPKRFSTLYVVPAFEVTDSQDPRTFDELSQLISSGRAKGFHIDYFSKGHNSTKFSKWLDCQGEIVTYPIEYTYMFEPYVVGSVHSLHRFDSRMRGYGINKWSWFAEANFRGYAFEVFCSIFLVHKQHVYRKRTTERDILVLLHWYEDTYWHDRYGAVLEAQDA